MSSTSVATAAISPSSPRVHPPTSTSDAKDRDHDTESTVTSAAATTMTKNTVAWPDVAERAREGDEREVDRVEHQLDAHEHDEGASLGQKPEGPDTKEHGGENEGTRRRERSYVDLLGSATWSRRANITAPTTAIISSAAVASKAKR